MTKAIGLLGGSVALLLALAACAAPPVVESGPTPIPSPTATLKDGVISDTCDDPSNPAGCVTVTEADCHPWEFAGPDEVEQISGWRLQIPEDSGPTEYATGAVQLDATGIPVAYVVAEGDIPDFVADRFCVNLAYLNGINGVRRMGAMQLFVGDTINLDAHTILTVGDQNGEVFDNPRPDPMPPQR